MKGDDMHEAIGWYFVMLPDREGTEAITGKLGPDARPILEHASGRPWIVGRMPSELVMGSTPERKGDRLAIIGFSSATQEMLGRVVDGTALAEQLDALSLRLSGSFHLLGSFAGRLRAQGSASGFRRIHHAVIDGLVIASDRADVLAGLGGFAYDEANLGIRLLRQLPHPLGEQPLWRGVSPFHPE
ncbi:hypothetical protein ACIBI9_53395 [Nonomuraea sp. NPDC050451]|uniref:hypothetical protein n=1 Tax=Nonomuraea sp. NPDC050451 TaxID=3364364 RepID=UPI00379E6D5A